VSAISVPIWSASYEPRRFTRLLSVRGLPVISHSRKRSIVVDAVRRLGLNFLLTDTVPRARHQETCTHDALKSLTQCLADSW
jgi:hypothetical protein